MTQQGDVQTRVFVYNDQAWDDPGPEYSIEEVRRHLTGFFPELARAETETRTLEDGRLEVAFIKRAGTKGKNTVAACPRCGGLIKAFEYHVCEGQPEDGTIPAGMETIPLDTPFLVVLYNITQALERIAAALESLVREQLRL